MTKWNVRQELERAGWYEERMIDTSVIEEHLINMGYTVFLDAKKFIKEFGMLELIINNDESDEDTIVHNINPIEAIGDYRKNGCFKELDKYAGEQLLPVGTLDNRYLVMFISETGKFFCDTGKLGNNVWEAWEAIINENGFKAWGKF